MDRKQLKDMKNGPIASFQWGHFFAEMDRRAGNSAEIAGNMFQLGHFFAEMDRGWFLYTLECSKAVSMGPLLRRNG